MKAALKYLILFALTGVLLFLIFEFQSEKKEKAPTTPEEALAAIEVPELPVKEPEPVGPKLSDTWNKANVKRGDIVKGLKDIKAGFMVDATSGDILWAKNETTPYEIASMTKMMTTLLAMEAAQKGEVNLDGLITASAAASKIGGSQVYLAEKEQFPLSELLKSVMILSANDSAYAVAEALGGDVPSFVALMNKRAKQLGMTSTTYYNPHGLPQKDGHNKSSALDQAILGRELLKFPKVLEWTSTRLDSFRNGTFQLANRNSLVSTCEGVDGLKTGFYAQAGYCVTATCVRKDHRMIVVIIGAPDKNARDLAVKNLLNWGYGNLK